MRLTLTASCSNGASASEMDRCWRTSASSKSLTEVPCSTRPAREIVPVATRRASTSVVLPAPVWPTRTTLRIALGWSATGALPAAPGVLAVGAMKDSFLAVLPGQALRSSRQRGPGACGTQGIAVIPSLGCPRGLIGSYEQLVRTTRDPTLLSHYRAFFNRIFTPLARALLRAHVSPDVVTV